MTRRDDEPEADHPEPPAAEPEAEEREVDPAERRRQRRILVILLTPLSLSIVAGFIATALTPTLLARAPLALIALDARNRNLILTGSLIDPVPFYLVATLRLFAVDPFTFVLGRKYGDAGVRWIETRFTSLKPTVDFLDRLFRRAGWLAVAIAPGAVVCTLAGAAGMGVGVFLVANILGTIARIALLREVGFVFAGPVDSLRRFFDRYIIWTTLASILLVAIWVWSERRQGRAETESPAELAEELEAEIEGRDDAE